MRSTLSDTPGPANAPATGAASIRYRRQQARIAAEVYELRRLRAENQVLTQKTREYEQNAGKLQAKVEQLHSIVSKLGIMAGLDHALPDTNIGGEGGVASFETVPPVELHTTVTGRATESDHCPTAAKVFFSPGLSVTVAGVTSSEFRCGVGGGGGGGGAPLESTVTTAESP